MMASTPKLNARSASRHPQTSESAPMSRSGRQQSSVQTVMPFPESRMETYSRRRSKRHLAPVVPGLLSVPAVKLRLEPYAESSIDERHSSAVGHDKSPSFSKVS